MASPWVRPAFVRTLATARLHVVVLGERFHPVTVAPRLDGAPPGAPSVRLDVRSRAEPDFLARVRSQLEQGTAYYGKLDRARLARSTAALQILFEEPDPGELTGLQTALALTHAIARQPGTTAIVDYITGAIWSPEVFAALPGDRPFDPEEHIVRVLVPSTRTANTRGLAKLARPDLLVDQVEAYHQDAARALLRAVAEALANGAPCEASRTVHSLPIGPGAPFQVEFLPPRPELGTETWGNTYLEIRELGPTGPLPNSSNLLEAVDRMMRSLPGTP